MTSGVPRISVYAKCFMCGVEIRIRNDGKFPWHSPKREAVSPGTDYWAGSDHLACPTDILQGQQVSES